MDSLANLRRILTPSRSQLDKHCVPSPQGHQPGEDTPATLEPGTAQGCSSRYSRAAPMGLKAAWATWVTLQWSTKGLGVKCLINVNGAGKGISSTCLRKCFQALSLRSALEPAAALGGPGHRAGDCGCLNFTLPTSAQGEPAPYLPASGGFSSRQPGRCW